jgi:hypothetical protein
MAQSIGDIATSFFTVSSDLFIKISDSITSEKVDKLVIPTLSFLGAVYFGEAYHTTRSLFDLNMSVLFGVGAIQKLARNFVCVDAQEFKKADMIEKALAIAGIAATFFSLFAAPYYIFYFQLLFASMHLILALTGIVYFDPIGDPLMGIENPNSSFDHRKEINSLGFFDSPESSADSRISYQTIRPLCLQNPTLAMTPMSPLPRLPNLGNTCFLNATLKAFFSLPGIEGILAAELVRQRTFGKLEQKDASGAITHSVDHFVDEKESDFAKRKQVQLALRNLHAAMHRQNVTDKELTECLRVLSNTEFLSPTPFLRKDQFPNLRALNNGKQYDLPGLIQEVDFAVLKKASASPLQQEVCLVLEKLYGAVHHELPNEEVYKPLAKEFIIAACWNTERFNDFAQHDAHDLLKRLCDAINFESDQSSAIISKQYVVGPVQGPLPERHLSLADFSTVVPDAETVTQTQERPYSGIIEISNVIPGKTAVTVEELLQAYFTPESNHHETQPKMVVNRLAHDDVSHLEKIAIRLPRFNQVASTRTRNNQSFTGLTEPISLPIFDIRTQSIVPVKIRIRSASCHHGSLGGGHYIALVRKDDGRWEYHSDSTIEIWTEARAMAELSQSAYNVFFEVVSDASEGAAVLTSTAGGVASAASELDLTSPD